MAAWSDRIVSSLRSAGDKVYTWDAGDGRLIVTPFAARILGCEMPGVEGNLFWHPPSLENANTAAATLRSSGGSGGERLWIAPEIGFMWKDLAQARIEPFTGYCVPPAMDPADWSVPEDSPGHLRLTTRMTLTDHRLNQKISLDVARQFDVIEKPDVLPKGVRCASFAIRNEVTWCGGGRGTLAGAWDLLQLPATGWLVCPTYEKVAPRSYYDPFGPRHVKNKPRYTQFLIDGNRRIKMGIAPSQTTGRMGFFRNVGRVSTLIVRAFHPQPGETYADLPRASEAFVGGDALQAYNDGGGGFGEMEYHDPAVVTGSGVKNRVGSCVTRVMTGTPKAIREAGRLLLGIDFKD